MFYVSEKEFQYKLKKIEQRNQSNKRKQLLQEAKYKKNLKLPSTTKMLTVYLFVVLNVVLVYCLIAMWHFSDLTYLGTLITDVIGQVLVFAIYAIKSTKENTKGGITYETAMAGMDFIPMNDTIKESMDKDLKGDV